MNGYDLASPDSAIEALVSLPGADALDAEVIRQGVPMRLTWPIVD